MSLILPHCVLDIFPTGKCINHGGEYGLENTVNFHFYRPKKSLNWPKNKVTKSKDNFNETVKHCLKQNLYKFLTRNALHGLLLGASAIERSVLERILNWFQK